jgi:SAM-dependent methyltransferase
MPHGLAHSSMSRDFVRLVASHVSTRGWYAWLRRRLVRGPRPWPPPVGTVDFGALATTRPISNDFGWDRGTPIDRFYIEKFLAAHADDIGGRVLEIGDDTYSRRFGGSKIARQDILHLNPGCSAATLVGDLTQKDVLPREAFNCIVLTQTLQLIFELEQAVWRLYNALKPGGVLLMTVPGISQIDRGEWADRWCWAFTALSIRKLFERQFSPEALEIKTHGNVFAAIAFLEGAAVQDVERANLEIDDAVYPLVITARAWKR